MSDEEGRFFQSADEAHEWLAFDSDEEERERAEYQTPDRFAEWREWWDAYGHE